MDGVKPKIKFRRCKVKLMVDCVGEGIKESGTTPEVAYLRWKDKYDYVQNKLLHAKRFNWDVTA